MERDELLRMLELSSLPDEGAELEISVSDSEEDKAEWSPTALVLDKWDLANGEEAVNDEMAKLGINPLIMADFFGLCYLPKPKPVELCSDPTRLEYVKNLMDSPEHLALHKTTKRDIVASQTAAQTYATKYAELLREHKKIDAEKPRKGETPEDKEERKAMAVLAAAGDAAEEAAEKVDEVREIELACGGGGMGKGSPGGKIDMERLFATSRRVRHSNDLKRIMELAGPYRRVMQSRQRRKVIHGYDDLVGVELSGVVSKMLPVELGRLACPELHLDTLRRIAESQVLCRQYQGVDNLGKGDFVLTVDESGSMQGEKVCQAKAFALAMAYNAKMQKRTIHLVGYSGGEAGNVLSLRPGKWDQEKLLDWLEHFYGCGSYLDVPVDRLPVLWPSFGAKKGKTDLIMISDGSMMIDTYIKRAFLEWKQQEQVKVFSLVIGSSDGELRKVSDQTFCMPELNLNQAGIQECLSI